MNLIALPAFTDNTIWMLHDGQHAVVVDPGEPTPVMQVLDAQPLELAAILVTHHHRANSDEPVAMLAALRPWKNDSR
jgi:hydroxyacylglutathione hydrolase